MNPKDEALRKIEEALREGHRRTGQRPVCPPDDKWCCTVMSRVRAVHAAKAADLQRFIWPFAAATAACALAAGLYALFFANGGSYSAFGVFIDDPSGISALQWFL